MGIEYTGEISPAPTIDGEFVPAEEWARATSYDLVTGGTTVYIMNDAKFLYVAFAVKSVDSFQAFNVFKDGAFTPNKMLAPVIESIRGWKHLDIGSDTDADDIFDAFSRSEQVGLFEAALATGAEFKVPLALLGVASGDAIKVAFVVVSGGTSYVYPSGFDAADPSTYADLTLTPIS